MTAWINVIIPMYNASGTVLKTLQSIEKAAHKANVSVHVLVVDDGSHDHGGDVVRGYAKQASLNIDVIEKVNGGCGSARNIGLNHATATWIMFCDADDLLHEDVILHHLELLNDPHVNVVKFGVNFNADPRYIHRDEVLNRTKLANDYIQYRNEGVLTYVWSTFIRHDVIKDNQLRFDERIKIGAEDNVFMMDLMSCTDNWVLSSFVGIEYVQIAGSIMNSYREHRYESTSLMFMRERLLMSELGVSRSMIQDRVWWFVRAMTKEIWHPSRVLSVKDKSLLLSQILADHSIRFKDIKSLWFKSMLRYPHKIKLWIQILKAL
jgi:glycosyltransferase involved in cell wall biosynthesis